MDVLLAAIDDPYNEQWVSPFDFARRTLGLSESEALEYELAAVDTYAFKARQNIRDLLESGPYGVAAVDQIRCALIKKP